MSCAPHCCPGPHLLITICHWSCAFHALSLLLPPRPIPPLPGLYTSQLLNPSHPFISRWLTPPKTVHTARLWICWLSVRRSVSLHLFPFLSFSLASPSSRVAFLSLMHSFLALLPWYGQAYWVACPPSNPHFNSASTPRLSRPSHIGK